MNAALSCQYSITGAREDREDAAYMLWETLLDQNATPETVAQALIIYETTDESGRRSIEAARQRLAAETGTASNKHLETIFIAMGVGGNEAPDWPLINDWLNHMYLSHAGK